MAEKIGLAILGKISEFSVEPIGRQLSYLFQLSGNVKTLQKELEKLQNLKGDVQFQVDVATDNVEYIFATVEKWLEDVGKAEGEAQTIIDDKARFPKGCLNGWFLNIKSRHALSRKANKRTQDIIDLRREGNFPKVAEGQRREPNTSLNPIPAPPVSLPDIVEDRTKIPAGCFNNWCFSLRAKKRTGDIIELKQEVLPTTGDIIEPQQEVLPDPCALIMGSTSTAFESRELMLKKIIESLKDEDINMIGICGMGGLGKTTMVEEVLKRVKEENMFDDYAKTVVSQTINITNIQKDIAEWLRLKLEESNLDFRASRLKQRLEGKKVLIIMDDVWEEFDLQALGITLQGGQRNCKIVFTSRTQGLWLDFESRRCELLLHELPYSEAWDLFKVKVGKILDEKPEFVPIAEDIVKECGGLPLAVVVLGSALRGRHKHTWNDTRERLRTTEGVELKVLESLKLSYDYLDNEAKSLFLLCSLFEEDSRIYIESLVVIGMGLQLFIRNSVDKARDRVFALVELLQSRCLVSKREDFITVHDVLRDVSKSIASTEKGSLVLEHGVTLEMLPGQTLHKHCTWISVISDRITEFPSQLQFPSLELLRCNNKGIQIPDRCFEGMVKLQVLDIICSIHPYDRGPAYVVSPKLPSSFQSLTSLHTLCLQNFNVNFTPIKFLKSLEILRITNIYIEELPKEIGHLTKLRLLDMSGCLHLERISPGIISGLTVLEELYLEGLDINWVAEENEEGRNAAHKEFESLSNLNILHIVIKDPKNLPLFNNLERYRIQIGDEEILFFLDSQNYERTFSISCVALEKDFNFPLHSSDALLLKGVSTENLVFQLLREASQSIKFLVISDTNTPEYLADVIDRTKAPFLVSTLETLTLKSLNNLQQIINGPLVPGNFAKLKKLDVWGCNQLRNIFRLSNAVDVLHLEKLDVRECESMEEVISWEGREEEADMKLQFPKLNKLVIGGKSLVCFCKGAKEIEFHQLRFMRLKGIPEAECIISISDKRSLNSIFPPKVLFPKLDWIGLDDMPNVKDIWCGQPQAGSFCNLTTLDINECDSLEYVFSLYTARYLMSLSSLHIKNCWSLKEVVSAKEEIDGQEEYSSSILSKLRVVYLINLPALERFCHIAMDLEFPELDSVHVVNCPEFKTFATGFVHTPKGNLNNTIRHLYEDRQLELAEQLLPFGKLKKLHVSSCKQPRNICQLSTNVDFVHLEELHVEYSESMADVISCERREEEANKKLQFPKLKDLVIGGESIVCFCKGATEIEFHRLEKMTLSSIPAVECIISTSDENPMNFIFPPKVLFPRLVWLKLNDMPNVKELWCGQPQAGSFCNLAELMIVQCDSMEYVFSPYIARYLVNLHTLSIHNCQSLKAVVSAKKEIWCSQLQAGSFCNLATLYFIECDSLEYVFSPYTARYLVNLGTLLIYNCQSLKEVVSAKDEIDSQDKYTSSILPKLAFVVLIDLPTLERFCHIAKDLKFPELSDVRVGNCPEFKTFAPGFVHTPKLNHVALNFEDEEERPWKGNLNNTIRRLYEDSQLALLPFGKLKKLHVSNCKQPRNICRLSTDVDLVHLKELHVEYSESMADVISCEGREEEPNMKLQFPKLKDLVIGGESIVCFCNGATEIEFHRLKKMTLSSIPAVECIISTSDENPMNSIFPPKVLFPKLVWMTLKSMPNVKEIWCGQLQVGSFCNLTQLDIDECDSLEYVFSPYTARYLVNLNRLFINNCRSLKEVVSAKVEIDGQEEYSSSILPKLSLVMLYDLPALERFCHIAKDLEFPELSDVQVLRNCPEFKTFAPGFVHTPKLSHVKLNLPFDDEKMLLRGNLNNTIRHLYEDQQLRRKQKEEK